MRSRSWSIRSFDEILLGEKDLEPDRSAHFLRIIHDESVRLTRLLDSTLDLATLERGEAPWQTSRIDPEIALESPIRTCSGLAAGMGATRSCSRTTARGSGPTSGKVGKFTRGSAHARGDPVGAGLGLAISWQIVQRFGGSLALLPGHGRGACLCVALARCRGDR